MDKASAGDCAVASLLQAGSTVAECLTSAVGQNGMKFALNLQRRDVPDPELIADVQRCARKIGRHTITMAEYEKEGTFHPTTLTRRFRSWFRVLEIAGLAQSRSKLNITDQELFDNLRLVWISLARQPRTQR